MEAQTVPGGFSERTVSLTDIPWGVVAQDSEKQKFEE